MSEQFDDTPKCPYCEGKVFDIKIVNIVATDKTATVLMCADCCKILGVIEVEDRS